MTAVAFAPDAYLNFDGTLEPLWVDGNATYFGVEVYTEGDCWALAWHIARLLEPQLGKGRIVTLGGRTDWWHVAVRVGQDEYLDITGIKSKRELSGAWGKHVIPLEPIHESDLEEYETWLDTEFGYGGHAEAELVAQLVIEKYCPDLYDGLF